MVAITSHVMIGLGGGVAVIAVVIPTMTVVIVLSVSVIIPAVTVAVFLMGFPVIADTIVIFVDKLVIAWCSCCAGLILSGSVGFVGCKRGGSRPAAA